MIPVIPIHGGNVIEEAFLLGVEVEKIIDASASIVPFKTPNLIKDCIINNLINDQIRCYPDQTYRSLRKVIAKFHKINPEMILPSSGKVSFTH